MSVDLPPLLASLALGLAGGAAFAWSFARRVADLERTLSSRDEALAVASERLRVESSTRSALAARLEEQQKSLEAEFGALWIAAARERLPVKASESLVVRAKKEKEDIGDQLQGFFGKEGAK